MLKAKNRQKVSCAYDKRSLKPVAEYGNNQIKLTTYAENCCIDNGPE